MHQSVNRLLPPEHKWIHSCCIWSEDPFKRIQERNVSSRRNLSHHQLLLIPFQSFSIVSVGGRTHLTRTVCSELNVPGCSLTYILEIEVIFEYSTELTVLRAKRNRLNLIKLHPSTLVHPESLRGVIRGPTRFGELALEDPCRDDGCDCYGNCENDDGPIGDFGPLSVQMKTSQPSEEIPNNFVRLWKGIATDVASLSVNRGPIVFCGPRIGAPLCHRSYFPFSSGYAFSRHSRMPPSIEITFL